MTLAHILFTGTFGSDDPTRATFPLLAARGALEGGHQATIALVGEAVYLMKTQIVDSLNAVGWPNAGEILRELVAAGVMFYV